MASKMDDVSSPALAYKFVAKTFDPEKYVKDLSSQCDTDAELQEHRKRIQLLSEETALALKKNVYKNYMQFIETSKEISYLEAEMYQLSHLLTEQRSILASQQEMALFGSKDFATAVKPAKKLGDEKTNSSIEAVEGLASVMELSDIHCVYEGDLVEVDQNTYIPRQKMHAFLLHDSMVMASYIPNSIIRVGIPKDMYYRSLNNLFVCEVCEIRGPSRYKFQALFELENIAVANVTSGDGVKDAFKILLFPETHIYQAESSQAKNEWLEQIEECKKNFKLKLEQEVKQGQPSVPDDRNPFSVADDRNPFSVADDRNPFSVEDEDSTNPFLRKESNVSNPFSEDNSKNPFLSDEDANNPFLEDDTNPFNDGDTRSRVSSKATSRTDVKRGKEWLCDLPEDLDVCIAQRDFEKAMELIDKTNNYLKESGNSQALKEIKVRVDHRVKQLVEALMKELDGQQSILLHGGPRASRRVVTLLVRLGRAAEACQLFLKNRSEAIKQSLRQLKIEGATSLYITKLSSMFFTSLIETGREFHKVFGESGGFSSAFVVWSNNELQNFVSRFSRQVFRRNIGLAAIGVCISIAMEHCEKVYEVGLELKFSMQHMLLRDVMEALFDCRDQLVEATRHRAVEEQWRPVHFDDQSQEQLNNVVAEMESCGLKDFRKWVTDGSRVDLASFTLSFVKGAMSFLEDGLRLDNPEIHSVLVECVADLFQNQVVQFEGALKSGHFVREHQFIKNNVCFILEAVLPVIKRKLKIHVSSDSTRFVKLHTECKNLKALPVPNPAD